MAMRRFLMAVAVTAATAENAAAAPDRTEGMALMSAMVSLNGTLGAGSTGVAAAERTVVGQYAVDFVRDVTNCAFVVSVSGGTQAWNQPVATAIRNDDPRRIVIFTNFQGNLQDRPFGIIVFCPN